ncbi:MAG: response regulator [Desulfobulbus sp.]|nr:response regulator [Desulfobulbus sp.]
MPLKIAGVYLVAAILWILYSDDLLLLWTQDPEQVQSVQTAKGLLGATVITVGLFFLMKREMALSAATTGHLRKNRQELLDILDAMPVGIVLTDGTAIEYMNINFSERFGYGLDEIPTREQWFLLAYPDPVYRRDLVGAWFEEVDGARKNRMPIPAVETMITCKDGKVRQAIVNTQIINDQIVIIYTDITERELMRNELIKIQKLESIGVLAGGIAHDFNNILTGIMGSITHARTLMVPEHDATQPLMAAEKATKRAAELTRQLLTFASGGEPVKKIVAVQPLVEEAVTLMLRGTNVRGEIQVDGDVQAIEADEGQLTQVLHNVIINAVQAMESGGILRVRIENHRLDTNVPDLPNGDYVQITVTDEGDGIPPEILERVFEPYFTTKELGSGLGLASAYSIMTRHDGQIRIESAVSGGTVCTLLLPATELPLSLPPASLTKTHHVRQEERQYPILVMDDEAIIRDMTTTMLKYLGYEVHACEDGETAVQLYKEALAEGTRYGAVLMDLTVPGGLGGLETSRRILALDQDACLVVSSGYSHDPIMADCRAYGFAGVLPKPYTMADLDQTLTSVMTTRTAF